MIFDLKKGESVDQREIDPQAGRAAVQAQRRRLPARQFPRPRRQPRNLPLALRGHRLADRLLRRRDRGDQRIRSAHRQEGRQPREGAGLRQFALRHARPDHETGAEAIRFELTERLKELHAEGQPARSPAARAADQFRSRDDRRHRQLQRDRELQPLSHRPPARRAAAHAVRISARECAAVRRREPPDRAADRRDVEGRSPAQDHAGRISASACRRASTTGRCASTNGTRCARRPLRLGDARRLGDGADRRRLRRTGHPPHRADRPAGRNPPGRGSGAGLHRSVPQDRQAGLSHAGHHADQADGRGSDRVHARGGVQGPLHAFRRRDAGADRADPRPAGWGSTTC
jgi:hypothetical protein